MSERQGRTYTRDFTLTAFNDRVIEIQASGDSGSSAL